MSALPKSTESNDATTPSTHAAEFDDQPREAHDHASGRGADPAASDAYPDGRGDGPDRDDGGREAGGRDPDDRNHHPDAGDGDPGAADADPDANGGNPDAANDALRQAPPSRTATAALIEPSGWAEMPPGPQAHFAVIGTDIQSITIKTTAVAKKTTDRKPKAPPTPPGGAEGGGDGAVPPTTNPQGDDAPSSPEPRKPRIEFTIPAGLEEDFRAAADLVRDQLIQDPKGRHELVRAVSCVADKSKWRSIAAEASDIKNEEGKVEETCAALLAFASEGHDNAIDRIAHFASRLRKDPAGAVKWYDVAFDACLLTLGNHVLWRGGLIQRLLKRAFPKLNWKEAAERRATRDKQAAAKAAKAAG